MIRPRPRTPESGGSSGCIASLTPAFSATGTTALRKYSRLAHNCSSVTMPYSVSGASRSSSRSKLVASAPPREGVVVEVRSQLKTGIHS